MSLTAKAIAAMQIGDILRDDEVRGLQLRCTPTGKQFYLYYRNNRRQERRPKLGNFGVYTVAEARRRARDVLREVAEGKDPYGDLRAERSGTTVSEVADLYERTKLPRKKSARSIKILLRHIRDHLGALPVASIDLPDVEKMHEAISETAPVQANRAVSYVSVLLDLAEARKLRPLNSNFCRHIERNPERRRRRYLDPVGEAKRLGAALRKRLYGPQHEAALFIYLLLLTGARKSEIGNASIFDRQGSLLHVGDHKTMAALGDKIIHLPKAATDLLDDPARPPHSRDGWLVGVADPRKLWEDVRKEAGCSDLRQHDLRHSFASFGLGSDVDLSMIGELLGHASLQTTKGYTHLIRDPAQAAVNRIAGTVAKALELEKANE